MSRALDRKHKRGYQIIAFSKSSCFISLCLSLMLLVSGCGKTVEASAEMAGVSQVIDTAALNEGTVSEEVPVATESSIKTGLIAEQILEGKTGIIHYSYYLPEDYDESRKYPLMMTMPGYDMMWFGEDSSGNNLNWRGFLCWTELPEDMIVVSAQLEDWGETSARQAIELTEYFINHYSVDTDRVYASGYSAGGETMSQAVSMRPDIYAAYLHGASQWDGEYAPIAENTVSVYIFMAENDEYYGSRRAREAYEHLYDAYRKAGWSDDDISQMLQIRTPDDEWFAEHGVTSNYHGGGNVVFEEDDILKWVVGHYKNEIETTIN